MTTEICQIEAVGMRMSLQDSGRAGWARYGVPPGGAMDDHAAMWANRLIENEPSAPVLELLGRGARLRFARETWIAVTGAGNAANARGWRAVRIHPDEVISFSETARGLWTYIAVEGEFDGPRWLGSVSGQPLRAGDALKRSGTSHFSLPAGVSSRVAPWTEQRDYGNPPPLRVWPAPQWDSFSASQRDHLFTEQWTVTSQSDRTGYRLGGAPIEHDIGELLSEPVMVGTIQVPPNGQPIVTMRDGPTVGGYAKLGVIDSADLSWLAQTRPGRIVSFRHAI